MEQTVFLYHAKKVTCQIGAADRGLNMAEMICKRITKSVGWIQCPTSILLVSIIIYRESMGKLGVAFAHIM